jgi:hypothetical protein
VSDPGDTIYCFTKGALVPIQKCVDNCGAPEMRPMCFAARGIAHSFDADGEAQELLQMMRVPAKAGDVLEAMKQDPPVIDGE